MSVDRPNYGERNGMKKNRAPNRILHNLATKAGYLKVGYLKAPSSVAHESDPEYYSKIAQFVIDEAEKLKPSALVDLAQHFGMSYGAFSYYVRTLRRMELIDVSELVTVKPGKKWKKA